MKSGGDSCPRRTEHCQTPLNGEIPLYTFALLQALSNEEFLHIDSNSSSEISTMPFVADSAMGKRDTFNRNSDTLFGYEANYR